MAEMRNKDKDYYNLAYNNRTTSIESYIQSIYSDLTKVETFLNEAIDSMGNDNFIISQMMKNFLNAFLSEYVENLLIIFGGSGSLKRILLYLNSNCKYAQDINTKFNSYNRLSRDEKEKQENTYNINIKNLQDDIDDNEKQINAAVNILNTTLTKLCKNLVVTDYINVEVKSINLTNFKDNVKPKLSQCRNLFVDIKNKITRLKVSSSNTAMENYNSAMDKLKEVCEVYNSIFCSSRGNGGFVQQFETFLTKANSLARSTMSRFSGNKSYIDYLKYLDGNLLKTYYNNSNISSVSNNSTNMSSLLKKISEGDNLDEFDDNTWKEYANFYIKRKEIEQGVQLAKDDDSMAELIEWLKKSQGGRIVDISDDIKTDVKTNMNNYYNALSKDKAERINDAITSKEKIGGISDQDWENYSYYYIYKTANDSNTSVKELCVDESGNYINIDAKAKLVASWLKREYSENVSGSTS